MIGVSRMSSSPHKGSADSVLALDAVFIEDERTSHLGLYTGVRCELPTGEVVEVRHKRTPLYDLARELDARGYGDWKLQAYTPTGTPSLHGLVKVMAELTVKEGRHGPERRKFRPTKSGHSPGQRDLAAKGTQAPEDEEMRASDSTVHEKAA